MSDAQPPSSMAKSRRYTGLYYGTLPDEEAPRALDIRDIVVRFGKRVVLEDVGFHVPKGEFLCLCGPNGAGKSTLLKVILGLVVPESGTVSICGETPQRARSKIGYVPQRKSFDRDFPATPLEVVVANLRGTWPMRITEDERKA